MRLKGKNIIITGASRGIGAGIARSLAREGAHLALTYSSNAEAAQKVLSELTGSGHFITHLDVASADSVVNAFDEIQTQFGKIDGLVNNAGITKDQLLLRMKDEDFDAVIQTNLRGTYLCTKTVMKSMLKARAGSIVNITSVIGQMGNPGQSNYAASKAGTEGFTRSVAQEVGSRGIRVNCVAPGFIVTDMTEALDDKQKQAILSKVPLNRLGNVEDVAQAVTYLLSDESTYVTGQVLQVNGGLYM